MNRLAQLKCYSARRGVPPGQGLLRSGGLSPLAQRGAEMTGCYTSLPAEDTDQMALVGEAGLLAIKARG